jgi:predicted amidophosphoribosyltransferase
VICCPDCHKGAEKRTEGSYRCRMCLRHFTIDEAVIKERVAHRPCEVRPARKEKYKGAPAGRITIPQFRYGGTRLG